MSTNVQAIQSLVEWINNNPERVPSATEASQKVNYDRSHFSKLFRRTTGITYQEYATVIKMGFAAAELRDTDKTIQEIAEVLGYSESAAFSHAFTNAYGCSPTDFQKDPGSIPILFCKIISTPNQNKGVITMKKIDPAKIIGDNFLTLLALQPAAIILYCFLASFAVSPKGMLKNYNPKGNALPCIIISSSITQYLPLSVDEIFRAIFELVDVDLMTIVKVENDEFHVTLNPIPQELGSIGFLEEFAEFVKTKQDD